MKWFCKRCGESIDKSSATIVNGNLICRSCYIEDATPTKSDDIIQG